MKNGGVMMAIEELKIERFTGTNEDVVVLVLTGPISVHTYEQLDSSFSELLRQERYNLVVDMAGVRYVSSAGAGVLMNMLTQTRDNNGGLVLINLSQGVTEIFELLNLSDVMPIASDLPTALTMLK